MLGSKDLSLSSQSAVGVGFPSPFNNHAVVFKDCSPVTHELHSVVIKLFIDP